MAASSPRSTCAKARRVNAGQVLVEMAAPDLRAAERALTSDYLTLLAQRARLVAERSGQGMAIPAEFRSLSGEDRVLAQQALQLQRAQMGARSGALGAEQSVLGQRSRQLNEQRTGYAEQRASLREQQRIIEDELRGFRELEKKGFASTNRVRALERAKEELRGREAAMAAEMARAGEGMGETRMQSLSLSRSRLEEVASSFATPRRNCRKSIPS